MSNYKLEGAINLYGRTAEEATRSAQDVYIKEQALEALVEIQATQDRPDSAPLPAFVSVDDIEGAKQNLILATVNDIDIQHRLMVARELMYVQVELVKANVQ